MPLPMLYENKNLEKVSQRLISCSGVKVCYLQVKRSRGKCHLKGWNKRLVSIQLNENDPKNPSLMMSLYSGATASFSKSVSGQKTVVYRSSSRTYPYAFTVSENRKAVIHFSANSETASQEWMAAIRAILWPPSPVKQHENMLKGSHFEIAIIDNDFSGRVGLFGKYGYLTITKEKLILMNPQHGYNKEWCLSEVDKFELIHQWTTEDVHKVLGMTTCSDSSTGKGLLLMFCSEAVTLLQSLASTIHQVLTDRNNQEKGRYEKELEEMAKWLVPSPSQNDPLGQVKCLLYIPKYIFNISLTSAATIAGYKASQSHPGGIED